jgi:hypothetical protein
MTFKRHQQNEEGSVHKKGSISVILIAAENTFPERKPLCQMSCVFDSWGSRRQQGSCTCNRKHKKRPSGMGGGAKEVGRGWGKGWVQQ